MRKPPRWLTDAEWRAMPIPERALHIARAELSLWEAEKAELKRLKKWGLLEKGMESSRPNWGPRVQEYLAAVNHGGPAPWCAAFVYYCLKEAGWAPKNRSSKYFASSCNILLGPHVKQIAAPRRGCLFGWCDGREWRGHIGFVAEVKSIAGVTWIRTIEGNSNESGSPEGNQIVMKWRRVTNKMLFAVPKDIT